MASPNSPISQLQPIHQSVSPRTVVVLVPGVGTAPPNTWFGGKGQAWNRFLPDDVLPSPSVYQFNHRLSLDTDSRLWGDVLYKGSELLEALMMLLQTKAELRKCAIFFIAHSLGGIIVKQCLTTALERKTDFRGIARSTAVFVAVATPHSTSEDPKDWSQPQLLAGTRALRKKVNATSSGEAKNLANLCLRFEGVVTNLHLLTLCETKETAIKKLFGRGNKALIVPRNMCMMSSELQDFIEVDANHLNIIKVASAELLEKPAQLAITGAFARIEKDLKEDLSPLLLEEFNIAYHNAAETLLNDTTDTTITSALNTSLAVTLPTISTDSKREGLSLVDFSTTKRDPTLPCHVIPHPKNKNFHDRIEVLDMIEQHLAPMDEDGLPRKNLKTFALCGPGGMGKTQVANEYAITHKEMYEAILWVHAEKSTTLADEFSGLAEHLGLVLEGSLDAMDLVLTRELVKGWLAKPVRSYNRSDNRSAEEVAWLLVFDNVSNMDLLSDVWPSAGSSGSILVTSRDYLAKRPFYQINHGIDLPQMTTDDASELLLKLTWREDDSEEQRLSVEVADILGGLPLALTQMAGVMVRQSLSFDNFLARYAEEEKHGVLFNLSLEPKHSRTNYGYTLASVWALEKLEYSSGLLDVMAFFDPDGIPEEYLRSAVGKISLLDYPHTITAYQEARSELLKSSLIMITSDKSQSNLTVHRMIQDAARAKMDHDRITEVFKSAVDLLWSVWPEAELGVRHHVARWKECEAISKHILRVNSHYTKAGDALKSKWITNLTFARLINELGWYFQERGNTMEALHCYSIAEKSVEHIMAIQNRDLELFPKSNDSEDAYFLLAEIHNNIAGSATELNSANTALHHFKIYNKMLSGIYNGQAHMSDSRLTSSFFNLGLSHAMKRDYDTAIQHMEQALKEADRLRNINKVKAAKSLAYINLGLTYWLKDCYEDASTILETALKEREELLGVNDRQSMITGRVLYGIGNVRQSQGDLEGSLQFHERALLHFKETVGNNHHRTGNSCFKVAQQYSRIGKLKDAMGSDLLDQAIKIFERHECYIPERGRVTLMKSIVLKQQGKIEDSRKHLEHASSLYEIASLTTTSDASLSPNDFDNYVHIWGR